MKRLLTVLVVLMLGCGLAAPRAGIAKSNSCQGRPPVDISRLPGVRPSSKFPSTVKHIAKVKQVTCDHITLWLAAGRWDEKATWGAFALYETDSPGDSAIKLYDLRSEREYIIALATRRWGVFGYPKSDGRWVLYREDVLNPHPSGEGLPREPRLYVVDLLTGQKRLLAASHVEGYPQIVSIEYDISQGKAIYRLVKGNPNAPSSEVHIVDLASGRDQLIRSYTWPRYAQRVAIDGHRAVWSLIMAPHGKQKAALGEVYFYDLSTGRGKLLTTTGYEWLPDIGGRYVAWIRSGGFLVPGRVVVYDLATGRSKLLDQHCLDPLGRYNRSQATWPFVGLRAVTWDQQCNFHHVYYDLRTGKIVIADATDKNGEVYADGYNEIWTRVLKEEPKLESRIALTIYKGADRAELPHMPNAGGGGMASR